jgi:hypothetical protein
MGYFVRAFCTDSKVPELNKVIQWLKQKGKDIELDHQMEMVDTASTNWTSAAIIYKPGKKPILVECNRDIGTEECLLREEINEFLEFIGSPGLSSSKREIIKHLKNTSYVIACQLPTTDMDDDGYETNHYFLNYFVENHGGLIQADAEGFYKGNKIIVKCE